MSHKDHTPSIVSLFNNVAEEYHNKFKTNDGYTEYLDAFIGLINSNDAHILDIGCGPGNIATYLLNKKNSWNITGIDLSPNMIEFARKELPFGHFLVQDAKELTGFKNQFNGIIASFILPYLPSNEINSWLSKVTNLLLPRGVFYLSWLHHPKEHFLMLEPSKGGKERMPTFFHDENDILNYLSALGFKIKTKVVLAEEKSSPIQQYVVLATKPF